MEIVNKTWGISGAGKKTKEGYAGVKADKSK